MDIVDKANDWIEVETEFRRRSCKPVVEVEETGECLYCGEALPKGRRWCDAEHRDAWEKENKRRR